MPTPKNPTTPPATLRHPRLLTTEDLAALLQLHPDSVKRMRSDGSGPAFVTLGRSRRVRYQPSAVSEWLTSQQRTSTKASARARD